VLKEGDFVSLNGVTGEVIKGAQPVKKPALTGDLGTFMQWVDAKRRLRVLTNAGEFCWFVRGGICRVQLSVL
jgi:pyruvate,orthophosphate dikinase